MPLHGFPLGIAEAIDLPENRAYVKTSPNLYINRQVEADIVARIEEEPHVVARVEEEPRVVARVEEPSVVARVDEPRVIARVEEEELPVTAHAEGPRKLHVSSSFNNVDEIKADIDTSRPIESVKHAVSKFEGSIDWKARRALNFQKRSKSLGVVELETADEIAELRIQNKLPEDLFSANKLIEELKQNLERAQREEHEAIQATEAAKTKAEELEQEIANESMHAAALSDLNSVTKELEGLHDGYACLVIQKDIAVKVAEEAMAVSEKIEQSLKDLTLSLRSADKDFCSWKLELQHVEEKLQKLHQQALSMKDLKSKLEASSSLLLNLKSELAAYMESKLKQEGEEPKKVLEEVNINIEKASAELDLVIATIGQSEETVSDAVASLKAELETKSQTASFEMKKKAAQEAAYVKSLLQAAKIELHETKEEAELTKARASAMESRLQEAYTELEDAKYYEKVTTEAVRALQEFESAENNCGMDLPSEVTLALTEYYELRKRVHEANSQIVMAMDSELNSLKKLEEVNQELAARREFLQVATEKAEKLKEQKLGVEQELHKLKADQELKRDASLKGKKKSNKSDQIVSKKKKKPLFQRFILFFSKKKSRQSKSMQSLNQNQSTQVLP